MTDLYLIAHKVRGEPAFDIAHQVQIGNEVGWIIPTSGWRAYPYYWIELDSLGEEYNHAIRPGPMPPDAREFYQSEPQSRVSKPAGKITSLNLADLGL